MDADIQTVEGLEQLLRAARQEGRQFDIRFGGWLYAYLLKDVRVRADTEHHVVKVGIAGALQLGKRLDQELAGANDEILAWLRAGANGSPRNLSAHGVAALPNRPAALLVLEPIDIGYEDEYLRAFGTPLGDAVYMPLAQAFIDAKGAAAAALVAPTDPEPPTHPASDALFDAAFSALHELRSAKNCVARGKSGRRRAYYNSVHAYLQAARSPELNGAHFAEPNAAAVEAQPVGMLVYLVTGPQSDIKRGQKVADALYKQMEPLKPLVEARIKRASVLAERAAAAALVADPGAHLAADAYSLSVGKDISWTSVLGKQTASGLGPTELVVASAERIAAVRAGGAAALRSPIPAPAPARIVLVVGDVEHVFAPRAL